MVTVGIMLLTLVFAYASFGHWLVRQTKVTVTPLEHLVLGSALSIAVLPALIALVGYVVSTISFVLLIPAAVIGISERTYFWNTLTAAAPRTRQSWLTLIVGICAVLSVGSMQFLSGSTRLDGVLYQEVHDSMWHVSLGKAILQELPPAHPADPSLVLSQYHYFFDVFLASLSYFSNMSLLTLNYQVSPVLTLSILLASAYVLGARMTSKNGGLVLLALTAWAGSFAYMIPWFLPDHSWGESSFWVSQTFAMLVNPQVLFSFACVYLFFLFQFKPFRADPKRHLILLPLVATSIGFKSYGWVVLSLLYAVELLWETIQNRNYFSILVGLAYLAVAAPFVWLITRFSASSTFFYEPLWYINTMVEAPDRLNHIQWKFLEDHYRLKQNWPRVLEIKTKEILVFYFGNLGVRSLFLLLLPLFVLWKKKLSLNWKVVTLAVIGFLFASIFPLLFLQVGVVWNSIQFWYYALILANILVLVTAYPLVQKIPRVAQLLLVLFLCSASIPAFIKTAQDKWTSSSVISHDRLALIGQLSEQDTVLICPEDTPLFKTTLVQAMSSASVIVSDPVQLELVSADQTTLDTVEELFARNEAGTLRKFLREHDSRAVLCSNEGMSRYIISELAEEENYSLTTADGWQLFSL